MRKIVPILMLLILPALCVAQSNHYVMDGGTGDGSDWNNAWDVLPSVLTRGDTYYVADGSYIHYNFNDAESGSTYIYIKKATIADHGTDTGWDNAFGDGQAVWDVSSLSLGMQFRTDYWDFDGQVGGGPGNWDGSVTPHGFRVETNAGDAVTQNLFSLISGDNFYLPGNIHVRHCEMLNTNVDPDGSKTTPFSYRGASTNWVIQPVNGHDNYTVEYCYVRNCQTYFRTTLTTNLLVQFNLFEKNIRESPGNDSQCQLMNDNSGKDYIIRWNICKNMTGTGILVLKKDPAEYLIDNSLPDTYGRVITEGWEVYGNLIYYTADVPSWSTAFADRGWFGDTSIGPGPDYIHDPNWATNDMLIYNNTIAGAVGLSIGIEFNGDFSTGNVAYNNLWYECDTTNADEDNFWVGVDTHDFNAFGFLTGGFDDHEFSDEMVAMELNGYQISSDPFTDSANEDYSLSGATDPWTTLGSPYNVDFLGTTRAVDGNGDMGALEFDSGGAAIPTLTTPTATSIGSSVATLGATIISDGGAAITSRGTVYNTTGDPVTENGLAEGGTSVAAFSHVRSSLIPDTLYYYRGYAVNSSGTAYSPRSTFTTSSVSTPKYLIGR